MALSEDHGAETILAPSDASNEYFASQIAWLKQTGTLKGTQTPMLLIILAKPMSVFELTKAHDRYEPKEKGKKQRKKEKEKGGSGDSCR